MDPKVVLLVQKFLQFCPIGQIVPSGDVSSGRVCHQQGYPLFVSNVFSFIIFMAQTIKPYIFAESFKARRGRPR